MSKTDLFLSVHDCFSNLQFNMNNIPISERSTDMIKTVLGTGIDCRL